MMRGGTLLILGHGVKGQGQLWREVVDDERRNPIDLGHGVKGQGQLWHSKCKTLWAR